MGMPALDPVWARAGRLVRATAAAVTSVIARDAGFVGAALLGDRATNMSDRIPSPWAGLGPQACPIGRKLWTERFRVNTLPMPYKPRLIATKPLEYGINGAGGGNGPERELRAL